MADNLKTVVSLDEVVDAANSIRIACARAGLESNSAFVAAFIWIFLDAHRASDYSLEQATQTYAAVTELFVENIDNYERIIPS